ncbi:phosphoribosyl-AMP cyclohydrolase [Neptuniibacter caesariensis]|uniref:Phosphoribosyl-AMP cyclohydrolase n=1 Tax=Neptuniibacter caesariensis TaxID=207954 RepID=A0A7U8C4E8_NEPCE|nr:phosphoribosyl-AMP cyclohydrolase [Neptuniibacter caesariensis]EAR59706.1 phosphoribosyl-AMP cyclohydrolase [Oceanospirillum sp. MED92] [Neptuniibacter caesariensis]
MKNSFYYDLESGKIGQQTDLGQALDNLRYNEDGLIPAIAQQHDTGEVLMMAWMNKASIEETLKTGQVCYWSRSRQTYWRKGESSGHVQKLVEMRIDCDGDTLLCLVNQNGPACHTERPNCFYHKVTGDKIEIITEPN